MNILLAFSQLSDMLQITIVIILILATLAIGVLIEKALERSKNTNAALKAANKHRTSKVKVLSSMYRKRA